MPMQPPTVTHQQQAIRIVQGPGRALPRVYDPPALAAARAKLRSALHKHRPAAPLAGPLRLVAKWCFAADGRHPADTWRITRPDTDNLNKLLKDCMTAEGFWQDDAQVASEVCEKFWADVPGIYILLEELDHEA